MYQDCGQRKEWLNLVYKGESFVRFPMVCLTCRRVRTCIEEVYGIKSE